MLGSPTITVKGRNLLAKIVAANIPLTLSNIGLGDGLQEENEEVIKLANEIMKNEIEVCTYNEKEGQYYIRRVFTNAELEEGFYIREVGIYAIDPDEGEILYAYTNAGETGVDYFAPGKGKVIVKEIIEMATKFGNAENITVIIDSSTALVTEKEFEEYKDSNKTDINNLQKQITSNDEDIAVLSNSNLLINGDFINPINQRSKTEYVSGIDVYTIDRWRFYISDISNSITINLTNEGITIKNSNDVEGGMFQLIEYPIREGTKLTVSVKVDGEIRSLTGIYTTTAVTEIKDDFKIGFNKHMSGYLHVVLYCQNSNAHTVEWVKLEIGDKATPFYPRSYGEELALCKRYYEASALDVIIPGMKGSLGKYEAEYRFDVEKRIVPTLIYGNGGNSESNKFALFTLNIGGDLQEVIGSTIETKKVRFMINSTDSNVNGTPCTMTGYIKADAEIY